jgi:hypothetical protein
MRDRTARDVGRRLDIDVASLYPSADQVPGCNAFCNPGCGRMVAAGPELSR